MANEGQKGDRMLECFKCGKFIVAEGPIGLFCPKCRGEMKEGHAAAAFNKGAKKFFEKNVAKERGRFLVNFFEGEKAYA